MITILINLVLGISIIPILIHLINKKLLEIRILNDQLNEIKIDLDKLKDLFKMHQLSDVESFNIVHEMIHSLKDSERS